MENNNVQSILSEPMASGTLNGNDTFAEQAEGIKTREKEVRKKSVMLFVATVLVIVVLIALAIAWYTRVANTYAVTFDVADYDLSVNENVDDEYLLNVYEYAGLTNKVTSTVTGEGENGQPTYSDQHTIMAPGTIGWIPLKISAYHSDVDVNYTISLDSKMPEELYKHMRFFILADKVGDDVKKTATVSGSQVNQNGEYKFHYGAPVDKVSDILDTSKYQKIYLDQVYESGKPSATSVTVLNDKITLKKTDNDTASQTLCIYWEWYWDKDAAVADNKPGVNALTDSTTWDALDTDAGRYPDKYYDAFTMYIKTSGMQAKPTGGQRYNSNE